MITRRSFMQLMAVGTGGWFLNTGGASAMSDSKHDWRMPDESETHKRTWMAFGASRKIWGSQLLPEVQRNLAAIALTIARSDPSPCSSGSGSSPSHGN